MLPVRAVAQWKVRDRFYKTYAEAEEDAKKRQAKMQKAFVRALSDGQSRGLFRPGGRILARPCFGCQRGAKNEEPTRTPDISDIPNVCPKCLIYRKRSVDVPYVRQCPALCPVGKRRVSGGRDRDRLRPLWRHGPASREIESLFPGFAPGGGGGRKNSLPLASGPLGVAFSCQT